MLATIIVLFVWVDLGLDQRVFFIFLSNQEILSDNLIVFLLLLLVHDTVEFQLDALELLPVATEAEDGF